MDPSFLIDVSSALQQRQMTRMAADRLQAMDDEKKRLADFQAWRRERIEFLTTASDQLVRDSNDRPLQTAVLVVTHLNRMVRYDITPESFDDVKEQEEVHLLWRKLMNIRDHCLGQLSDKDKQTFELGIQAFHIMDLIKVTADRVDAYNKFNFAVQELQSATKMNKMLKTILATVIIVPTVILVLVNWVFASIASPYTGIVFFISFVLDLTIIFITFRLIARKKDKRIPALQAAITQTRRQGAVDDTPFWDFVRAEFGCIPTHDQLKKTWAEQGAVLDTIFPAEPEEDHPHQDIADMNPVD
jgi:hypothetical protein